MCYVQGFTTYPHVRKLHAFVDMRVLTRNIHNGKVHSRCCRMYAIASRVYSTFPADTYLWHKHQSQKNEE
jgi:hypothetical protein